MLEAEQILQGHYQLKQQLGNNPSRQTWLAEDLAAEPRQQVVIKLLPFSPQTQWNELKLFEREAQVLKHLNHPRIPRYRDYFSVDQAVSGGVSWFALVQDYIPGSSLQQQLKNGKLFTEAEAKEIATQLLNILIYLHELSPPVLHRHIKPSNIIWTKNKQLYLVDFGAVQDKAKAEGVTFTVMGTRGYSPPEQLWGRAVPASDLYAVGATLIHLLTGIYPANFLPQHRMRLQFRDKVSLNPGFASWLEKLTAPAPERRFSQARQALSALQGIKSGSSKNVQKAIYGKIAGLTLLQYVVVLVCVLLVPAFRVYCYMRYMNEAKSIVASMGRAQQAYYLETGEFIDSFPKLSFGIKNPTENYEYSIYTEQQFVLNYAISRNNKLKSYVGIVFPFVCTGTCESGTTAILCEAKSLGISRPAAPIVRGDRMECGTDTTDIFYKQSIKVEPHFALAYSSWHYAEAGQYDKALTIAQTIQNNATKAEALTMLARKLTAAGKTEQAAQILSQALQIEQTIKSERSKEESARELAAAGQFDQAIQVAQTINNYYPKASALNAIARELAAAGQPDRALQIAETIESYYGSRDKMLEAIAGELAAAGEFEPAIQVAKTIKDYYPKASALNAIAYELAAAGEFDQAIQVAKTIKDYYSKASALDAIASYQNSKFKIEIGR